MVHNPHDDFISPAFKGMIITLVAVGIHALMAFVPVDWFSPADSTSHAPIAIEKWIEPKGDDRREVVKTSKAEEQVESNEPAKYFGEFKNRVRKESRADMVGRFQERRELGTTLPGANGDSAPPGQWGIPSASPNQLPDDIEKGGQTVLNADPVIYASYINRIGDEIYDTWTRNLYDATLQLNMRKVNLEQRSYHTALGVYVNKVGGVTQIEVLRSCGITEFDNAAKEAFWRSEPFQNPPKQLFKTDEETAMLAFGFNYEMSSSRISVLPQSL